MSDDYTGFVAARDNQQLIIDQLRAENTKMKILLRNYVKAEHNHDEAYDVDRSYTILKMRKERKRVYAFLSGEVDDEEQK